MNKAIKNLAIAALFCFGGLGLSCFAQEEQDFAASDLTNNCEMGEPSAVCSFEFVGGHIYGW